MPWLKMDDQFIYHEKARLAGKEGRNLQVTALCYCAGQLNDGLIRDGILPTILALAECNDGPATVAALVAVGMWEAVPGGYQIHDYLKYNPSREQVLAERAENARRQAEWYAHKREQKAPPNALPNGVSDTVSNRCPVPGPVPVPPLSTLPPQPEQDDDPLVARMESYGTTYTQAVECTAGKRAALAPLWMDYLDAHRQAIPNAPGFLVKSIKAGKPPPSNSAGPPGKPETVGDSRIARTLETMNGDYKARARRPDTRGP